MTAFLWGTLLLVCAGMLVLGGVIYLERRPDLFKCPACGNYWSHHRIIKLSTGLVKVKRCRTCKRRGW
jgi:hypothetical protein